MLRKANIQVPFQTNSKLGFASRKDRSGIMPNVLHNIGNTPLIRINKIAESEGVQCELSKRNKTQF